MDQQIRRWAHVDTKVAIANVQRKVKDPSNQAPTDPLSLMWDRLIHISTVYVSHHNLLAPSIPTDYSTQHAFAWKMLLHSVYSTLKELEMLGVSMEESTDIWFMLIGEEKPI